MRLNINKRNMITVLRINLFLLIYLYISFLKLKWGLFESALFELLTKESTFKHYQIDVFKFENEYNYLPELCLLYFYLKHI